MTAQYANRIVEALLSEETYPVNPDSLDISVGPEGRSVRWTNRAKTKNPEGAKKELLSRGVNPEYISIYRDRFQPNIFVIYWKR